MEYELSMLLDPWSKLIDKLIVAHIVDFLLSFLTFCCHIPHQAHPPGFYYLNNDSWRI